MDIKLGKKPITLVMPSSYAMRYVIVRAAGDNTPLAFAAALGACGIGRRHKIAYKNDPLDYGAQVIDALIASKLTIEDIQEAGATAWNFIARATIKLEEVIKDGEGFTEPTAEPSSSP